MIERLRLLLELTRAHSIARRYFVTNGFDGALTMLGLNMGFYSSGGVETGVVIHACLGAAIALGTSGVASAYVSESAEREKDLKELEQAVASDLANTAHGEAARWVPFFIAAVNGLAPFLMALIIIVPLWMSEAGIGLPIGPLQLSIVVAFVLVFLLGIFLGSVSGRFWLWSGLRTLVIAIVTAALILMVGG
jgi:predicted membrane protein (TIGR00267 family)